MYLLFCTDFYIFRNFVFFVFLVVQYRRSVICKIKRLDTNTRDFGYSISEKFRLQSFRLVANSENSYTEKSTEFTFSFLWRRQNSFAIRLLQRAQLLRNLNYRFFSGELLSGTFFLDDNNFNIYLYGNKLHFVPETLNIVLGLLANAKTIISIM